MARATVIGELVDPVGDRYPGSYALLVARRRQLRHALFDVLGGSVTMLFEHLLRAGP